MDRVFMVLANLILHTQNQHVCMCVCVCVYMIHYVFYKGEQGEYACMNGACYVCA